MQHAEVWAGDAGTIIPETAFTWHKGEETTEISWIYPVDHVKVPVSVAITLLVEDGDPTVTVEHTLDNVLRDGFDPASAPWSPHPDANALVLTEATDINYFFPISGFRIIAIGGTVRALVRQAG